MSRKRPALSPDDESPRPCAQATPNETNDPIDISPSSAGAAPIAASPRDAEGVVGPTRRSPPATIPQTPMKVLCSWKSGPALFTSCQTAYEHISSLQREAGFSVEWHAVAFPDGALVFTCGGRGIIITPVQATLDPIPDV